MSFVTRAQMMGNAPPPLKDISEIKALLPSIDKSVQIIRYARHPKMIYSNDLSVLLDEALQFATMSNKDDLVVGLLSTKAIVDLGLGKQENAISSIKQAETYLSKLDNAQAVSLLTDLSRVYNRVGDLEKTYLYYDKIEAATKDKPQFIIQRVLNLRNRSNRESRSGNFEAVKTNFQLALKLAAESNNPLLLKDTRFAYANALLNMRREEEAFDILKALIPDLENTLSDRTGQFFDILSRNYESSGDYKNAFIYAEKVFNLANATTQQKSNAINRMISLSFLLKNYSNFDTYFLAHQKYGMDENNLISKKKYHLAESRYYDAKERNEQAKKSYLKTLNLKLKNEFTPQVDLETLTGLANIFVKEGKRDSALYYFKKAENLIKKNRISPAIYLIYTNALKTFQLNTGNGTDQLVKSLEQEIHLKDTLYQMGLSKIATELETKYRVNEKERALALSKKQQQVQSLELKQQQQRGWLTLTVAFLAILFISGITYLIWLRKKQAALLHKITVSDLQQQHRLAILNTLTETQEQEKKRIAERLHDEVGAMLSIAKLNINTLKEEVYIPSSGFENKLLVAQNLMNDISETVRHISHALMPIALERYGFKAAILDLISTIQTSNQMHVEYLIEGFEHTNSWPKNFTLSTYRIIQEIINNSIKHAEASHLFIQLIELENTITIYIEDNGKGISDEETSKKGVGMTLLKTNIDYLSGTLEISGKPNEGTFTLIELPFPQPLIT